MNIDIHNHTKRCNHATGECFEYVESAINCHTDIFGFACHAPMKFDEKYRMALCEIDDYMQEIRELGERYKNKIDIRLGFEVDYINKKEYLIERKVLDSSVDYLIGSVHFLNHWGFDNEEFIGVYESINIDDAWIEYLESIANMAQSGLFDIVGHFDLFKIFNNPPSKNLKKYIAKTLESIKDNHMVLEINSAGFRKKIGEMYPSREILELVFKCEIPITFSSDAHNPNQVGFKRNECKAIAKEIGFKKAASFKGREIEFYDF